MFVVIALLYFGYRFIKEETGNGDFYRSMARMPHNTPEVRKAYEKRANESDGAVAFDWFRVVPTVCTVSVIRKGRYIWAVWF